MLKEFPILYETAFAPDRKEDYCDGFPGGHGRPNRGGYSRGQHGGVLLGGGKR